MWRSWRYPPYASRTHPRLRLLERKIWLQLEKILAPHSHVEESSMPVRERRRVRGICYFGGSLRENRIHPAEADTCHHVQSLRPSRCSLCSDSLAICDLRLPGNHGNYPFSWEGHFRGRPFHHSEISAYRLVRVRGLSASGS